MKITYNNLPKLISLLEKHSNDDITLHFITKEDISEVIVELSSYILEKDSPRLFEALMNSQGMTFTVKNEEFYVQVSDTPYTSFTIVVDKDIPKVYSFLEEITKKYRHV